MWESVQCCKREGREVVVHFGIGMEVRRDHGRMDHLL